MAPPNQLGTVQRIRGKYPTPLGAQHPAFLIELARATGAKLLRKEAGSNIQLPTGVRVSQDFLIFDGFGIDVLADAEGQAIPTWQEKGPTPGEYVDVGEPEPKPEPEPGNLDARVTSLERRVQRLETGSYRLVPE